MRRTIFFTVASFSLTARMKKYIAILFFVMLPPLCHAQANQSTPIQKSVLSLDFMYLITGTLNQGGGIGIKYEHGILNYFSLRGGFGHMTFKTGIDDVYCTSVNLSLYASYYPFGNGLDKLYIGIGNGCEFMNYFGSGQMPEETNDTLISLTPIIGYKFNFKPLMIDLSLGYKFIILSSNNYSDIEYYVNKGIQIGIGFNIHFKEIRAALTKNNGAN